MTTRVHRLQLIHRRLKACERCPHMHRPVVHGPAVESEVFLLGQAPGVKEGPAGKPFAWTAGKTLFGWFKQALGVEEERIRQRFYFAAVARCFPGKNPKGGDRRPNDSEVEACRSWLSEEVAVLQPKLILPVGTLAIEQVLNHWGPLAEVVGRLHRAQWHGVTADVLPLPHPSGASTWHRTSPGNTLLRQALELVKAHPVVRSSLR